MISRTTVPGVALAALFGLTLGGASTGPTAVHGAAGAAAPTAHYQHRAETPLNATGWVNGVRVHTPVNPPGVPTWPSGMKATPGVGAVHSNSQKSCYPAGTAGYQSDCFYGYEWNGATPYLAHWGNEPYLNTGIRYVWVVDDLRPGSREREILQYLINGLNGGRGTTGPYFVYAPGENYGLHGCANPGDQYIVACYRNTDYGQTTYWYDGLGHFGRNGHATIMQIGSQAYLGGDPYLWNEVIHEFGHAIGFAHDTDCNSVMTYCSTFDYRYLGYAINQQQEYTALYRGAHYN